MVSKVPVEYIAGVSIEIEFETSIFNIPANAVRSIYEPAVAVNAAPAVIEARPPAAALNAPPAVIEARPPATTVVARVDVVVIDSDAVKLMFFAFKLISPFGASIEMSSVGV